MIIDTVDEKELLELYDTLQAAINTAVMVIHNNPNKSLLTDCNKVIEDKLKVIKQKVKCLQDAYSI